MSSIAYVTDKNMIAYHRLNGNNQLNFWRPSSTMRFSDFRHGDLLFFLAKGTEKSKQSKEKGIIGYGRFSKGEILTPRQAWKRYGTLNGYQSKEELFEAIARVNKNRQLPTAISCLYLQQVVFFQGPLYLSELGVELSNRVESYVYLDKEDETVTVRILEKAKEVGIDAWSLSLNYEAEPTSFEVDQTIEILAKIHQYLEEGFHMKPSDRKMHTFARQALSYFEQQDETMDMVKGSSTDLCAVSGSHIAIYVPLLSSYTKQMHKLLPYVIGRLHSYRSLLTMNDAVHASISLYVYTDKACEPLVIKWLENCDITPILIKP